MIHVLGFVLMLGGLFAILWGVYRTHTPLGWRVSFGGGVVAGSFGLWAAGGRSWVSLAFVVLLVSLESVLRPAHR